MVGWAVAFRAGRILARRDVPQSVSGERPLGHLDATAADHRLPDGQILAMATLEIIAGGDVGRCFPLDAEQSVIGRYPFCEVVLPLHTISRQHARILRSGKHYYIEDLGSLNGTIVNEAKIEDRVKLTDQDVIRLFEVMLVFHAGVPKSSRSHASDDPPSSSRFPRLVGDERRSRSRSTQIHKQVDLVDDDSVGTAVKLKAVLEVTRSLGSSLDLDEVLPKALDSLFVIFPQADRGYILMAEGPNAELEPRALKRRGGDYDTFGPISRTMAERVMTGGEAILSTEAGDNQVLNLSESVLEMRIYSMMCAPLIGPSRVPLGIITIETGDVARRFDGEDLDLLVTVATVAGQAVEYVRAHEAQLEFDRRERELEVAHEMQLHFLPKSPPKVAGYEFFDYYQPASQVGGDYYGYIELPDGQLAVAVGDVSGKGVPAALVMARLCSETQNCLLTAATPAAALKRLDRDVLQPILDGRFVTFVLCVLDPVRHRLSVVSAGHMAPICRHADGQIEELGNEQKGLPLGLGIQQKFAVARYNVQPGDTLVLYTDGISEAQDKAEDIYRIDRLHKTVAEGPSGAQRLGRAILADVRRFTGDEVPRDDACLICFSRE